MGIQNGRKMKYVCVILIWFISSCSAQWYLNKAVKKGVELEKIKQTQYDTTYFTDHYYHIDTIHNEHTIVRYVPETRWKTRIEYKYDYKRFKDSLKHYQRVYSDSLKNALRTTRIENKTERKANNKSVRMMWLILICSGILALAILMIKFRPF
jgi:hypothetical protein